MDGHEMLHNLRQRDGLKDIKIIVSSASVSSSDRQSSIDAGADDFLPKPVATEALFTLLAQHLGIRWAYERTPAPENGNTENGEANLGALAFIIPPVKEMQSLYLAAQIGDIREIEREAERIQQLDTCYQPFSRKLMSLAADMNEQAILSLIKQSSPELLH
jgi:response regulator RpfG family c-di-GMP phosphodiesterase